MGNCSSNAEPPSAKRQPLKIKRHSTGLRGSSRMNVNFVPNPSPKVEEHIFALCMRPGPMNEVETYCSEGSAAFESALGSKPGSVECQLHLETALKFLNKARDVEESRSHITLNLGITYLHLGHIFMFFNDRLCAESNYQKGKEVMAGMGRTIDGYQLLRRLNGEKDKKVSISDSEPEVIERSSPRTPETASSSSPRLGSKR